MPNKNHNKNAKTRKRIPRTLLPVLAATAAYAATTPTPVNPYPETYAFCHLPKGATEFQCEYSLKDTQDLRFPDKLHSMRHRPNKSYQHGHVYSLKRTPGIDPREVNNLGCPENLTSANKIKCRTNFESNIESTIFRGDTVITPYYPIRFSEGFRFPTYEQMQMIKAEDPTAPDPNEPASRWQTYLEFCRQFPKICGASALIAALGLGLAVRSNKKEYNRRVVEGTRKYLQKLKNEGTKFTQRKGNQGKAKPSWAPGKR